MMIKKIKVILCLSIIPMLGFSQVKKFTTDRLKFADEVKDFFSDAKVDEGRIIAKRMGDLWEATPLKNEQEQQIIAFANEMLDKKFKASPELKDYFSTINNFITGKHSDKNFDTFFQILEKLINQKPQRDFTNFLDFANHLFEGNNLYYNPASRWYFADNSFILQNDSVPVVIANDINIYCAARGDHSTIYKTSGVYFPLKKMWNGKGGNVNWSRSAQDSTQIYAELRKYKINTSISEYKADSVIFYDKNLFTKPLNGFFEEKLTPNYKPENATYPKFTSYQTEFFIKDIFKKIDYRGGFSMEGNKLVGLGQKGKNASLEIYLGDTLAMRASSKAFSIYPDRIISYNTRVSIFLGKKDSVYHPEAEFKFLAQERKISLLRKENGVGHTPFYDSFHHISLEADAIYWNINEPTMEIGMVERQTEREAFFESTNYFREFKYRKVQGVQDYNPLALLKSLVEKAKSNTFPAKNYADALNLREVDVKNQLRELVEGGFILFDEDKNIITVKERAINWVKNSAGTLDYDILKLTSLMPNNKSATLNLRNLNLEIRGVDQIFLSDSQSVYIAPSERTINMKGNRNMTFGGRVHAGTLDFFGKGFSFDYENFKIALLNIDSLTIKVLGGEDARGRKQLIRVQTVLQNINGDLYIDDKNNKSGLKDFSQYPLFDSKKESFVYYDYPFIQRGLYHRDVFYFRVVPFKIDSLDNLTSTQGLAFPGVLYSGDIFPPFEETLVLQPDTTLGFVSKTPPGGYPIYRGKGRYNDVIRLSQKGLYGTGKLDYLTSTTYSDNYLFFIDSMQAPVKTYDIRKENYKNTAYPQLRSKESYMRWIPYIDSMFVYQRNKEEPMRMYDHHAILEGDIVYTPLDLTGRGLTRIKEANLFSNYFEFGQNSFKADTSRFLIFNPDSTKVSISCENANSKIDFSRRQGNFKTNAKGPNIRFPQNEYVSSLRELTWYFDKKYVDIIPGAESDYADNYFLSTRKKQDSLQFYAEKARYSLQPSRIDINGVPSILVADAEIFPDSNHVVILPEAVMKTLQKAKITANTKTKLHNLYDAKLDILGRRNYTGEASYDYKNKSGELQTIRFNTVKVDTAYRTRGISALADTNFRLNPRIFFKGDVVLKAEDRYFNYKGFARIEQYSNVLKTDYFSFEGEVNPDSSLTEILDPRNQRGDRLFIGLHIANSSGTAYGTFISKKTEPNDLDIFKINGVLLFDEKQREFRMGQKEKLFGNSVRGDYYVFNEVQETIYGEGKFNLGVDFGEGLKYDFRGSATDKLLDEKLSFDAVSTFDFKFLDKALSIMTEDLIKSSGEAAVPRNDRPMFIKALTELLDNKAGQKAINDIQLYGTFNKNKLPKDLEHTLSFSEINMYWDKDTRSFRSKGPVGILAINDKLINKQFKCYMTFVRKRNADSWNLYIEANPSTWYFLSYSKGLMEGLSSNQEFNQLLQEKAKADSPFSISTAKRKVDLIRSFEKENEN